MVETTHEADVAVEAERSIIGTMLVSAAAADRARTCLTPAAFSYQYFADIFRALCDMRDRGEPPSLLGLELELATRDQLQRAGGPAALSALTDHSVALANLEVYARIVRAAHARRERVKVGLQLANGGPDDPEATRQVLARLEATQRAVDGLDSAAKKWAASALSGRDLVDAALPPIASWLGDGLLPSGELAFLTGQSGVGKTFLIVQLMSALSIGHTFNGLPTRSCRVGLVEIEMPWVSIQKRVASLHSGDLDQMSFVCSPPGSLHVAEAEARENLTEFCRKFALDVLIIDPFNRLHDGDENSGSDMGHTMEGLHALRQSTGAAIVVLHHVRKSPAGLPAAQHTRSSSLDSGRGHSRLHNDPATVMNLDETKGFVRLSFAKVRHAREPAPIYLKRNEAGFFDVADDPALAKDKRRDALTQMLEKAGAEGVEASVAAEILKVTERTLQRDFKDIGATMIAHGRNRRLWVLHHDGDLGL